MQHRMVEGTVADCHDKLLKGNVRLIVLDVCSYDFNMVLVDPPRSGLDATTCDLVCHYDHIVYISCNPAALSRDLDKVR